jgi:hypothetical protein
MDGNRRRGNCKLQSTHDTPRSESLHARTRSTANLHDEEEEEHKTERGRMLEMDPQQATRSSLTVNTNLYSLYTFSHHSPQEMGADRSTRQVQPPRPPNAWILYRSDKIKQLPPVEPGAPRRAQSDVSKMISRMWREESESVKAEYEKRADVKKAEHQAKYPNYRFQPMKKSEKEKLREQSKEKDPPKRSRRAAPYPTSAPTPAPSQYSYSYPELNAPSPPLSAASSTPSSPNPLPPLYLDPEAAHVPPMTRQVSSSASSAGIATPAFTGYMLPSQAPSQDWTQPTYSWDLSAQPSPATWPPQNLPEAPEDPQPVEVCLLIPVLTQILIPHRLHRSFR